MVAPPIRRMVLSFTWSILFLSLTMSWGQVPPTMYAPSNDMSPKVKGLQAKAVDGDVHATELLGEAYLKGKGVTQNYEMAEHLFLLAADQNDPAAQIYLGTMHCQGLGGIPHDPLGGAAWFHVAADQGYAEAETDLGVQYLRGEGVPHNRVYGAGWVEKAANQGFLGAKTILGTLYMQGEGVPQDYKKAVFWLRKAANQDDAKAEVTLSCLLCGGKGITRDYRKALALAKKAAAQDYPLGELELGDIYRLGLGCNRNSAQAITWYQKAAAHTEDPSTTEDRASVEIAIIYATGNGVPQDTTRAREIIDHLIDRIQSRAADGDAAYEVILGELYEIGCVVPKNRNQALALYQKAASQGEPDAQRGIARIEENDEPPAAPKPGFSDDDLPTPKKPGF